MRKAAVAFLIAFLVNSAVVVVAQTADFQTGKIVAVQKVNSGMSTGGTDAPTAQNRQRYHLSIQLNDSVYVCRADVTQDMDLEWAQGKEVPVRVKGKVLELKRASGKIVKLSILSSKKAE